MTVIKNTVTNYQKNDIKLVLKNNSPIEDKLHVVAVVSNPCSFNRRFVLFDEFMHRMNTEEPDVLLYVVELVYGTQKFVLTDNKNPRHLQLRTNTPLWHKENMINLGVQKLLPANWKAFAWIDGDLEFESSTWAIDTLKILNGHKDIVQVWSHCVDMDKDGTTMRVFNSAGSRYAHGCKFSGTGNNYWHPGYAWAMTRKAYERIGGLYDYGILGSGDNIMMLSLLGNGVKALHEESSSQYKETVTEFEKNMLTLRFGYTPGTVYHFFHGTKQNRRYTERWKILVNHNYNPVTFLTYDEAGLLVPTANFPQQLALDIMKYFSERQEDD